MTRLLVDVQLEILVVVEETTPLFVDDQVQGIALLQHVVIVAAGN